MKLAIVVSAAMLVIATTVHAADTQTIVSRARQQIENADYRATGRLVKVDADGKRTNYSLTIEARWFPGVLRALVEIDPRSDANAHARGDDRLRILLETRANGQDAIRIARPDSAGLVPLPFDKWNEGVFGGAFSYEDFLESQYYWQHQAALKSSRYGARQCDVLKSAPGPSDRTHYAEVLSWLDSTIAYPVYVEKTLKDGGGVKEFTYLGLRKTGGVWSANQVEAKIRGHAGSTLLIIDRGSAKANLNISDFSAEKISHFEDHP